MVIRPLRASDIDALDAALRAAYGWPGTYRPWLETYLGTPAIASFVADVDGEPAGCVFCVTYGTGAYVALMGVEPAMQGRGIGGALFDALIAWSDERGLALALDATTAGAPLYVRAGFADQAETIVFSGTPSSIAPALGVRRAREADFAAIVAADSHAFGANRSAVLANFFAQPANATFVEDEGGGFVMARHGEAIGPLVARGPDRAAALFDAAIEAVHGADVRVFVPSQHAGAIALARSRGLTEARRLRHMTRGAFPAGQPDALWMRANLGKG